MDSRFLTFLVLVTVLAVLIGIWVFLRAGNENKRLARAGKLLRKRLTRADVSEQLVADGASPKETADILENALANAIPAARAGASGVTTSAAEGAAPPPVRPRTASDRTAMDPSLLADTLHERGIALYKRGEHALAIDALTQAIELDPLFPNSYILRAVCYRRLDNFTAASADDEQAEALGGPEKTAWDRMVNRSRHRWRWDFDNPEWQRTDPLSRKAVLFHTFMSQIYNGGLHQWVANGYGRWIGDLIEAARDVDTPATREVAALLEELAHDLANMPLDYGWNEDGEPEEQDDRIGESDGGLGKIHEYETRYMHLESRFGQDVADWLEHKAATKSKSSYGTRR
jgi:tetratricopeptide (TPR) repeat protein